MARKSKEIKPLFPMSPVEQPEEEVEQPVEGGMELEGEAAEEPEKVEEKEKDHHQPEETLVTDDGPVLQSQDDSPDHYTKYKREPKYKTHVSLNTRIPRELRREMEKIARKLGVPINKNSGFFQEFTTDALRLYVEKVKKDLGID